MPNHPDIATYLPEFLKRDMLHVYRQVAAMTGVKMHVFTHKRENPDIFPFNEKRLHLLPKPRLRWWRRFWNLQFHRRPWQIYDWELRHLILELTRIDARLMHVFFGHIGPQFRPLMRAWPHPVVVSFHGADAGVNMDKPGHLAALRDVFELADRMLCRSESLAADLQKLGCPPEKIGIWRTGVPLEQWPMQPREPAADGEWRLTQVCRFVEKKGLDLTLEAFALIRREFPKARLTLIGDGPCAEALRAQAAALGLDGEAVTFTGFLRQGRVRATLYESNLFLHPSRTTGDGNREGIPNSALEAMASGMPVIATDHGGFPEAITSEESGILVPENRADLLADAALRVLRDADLRRRLAEGGRRSVENKFGREAQMEVLRRHYTDLIAAGKPAR
jgi:colanic acid/amylovoran biosynthesis glycosyltransferase